MRISISFSLIDRKMHSKREIYIIIISFVFVALYIGFLPLIVVLSTLLFHELGHYLFVKVYNVPNDGIKLNLFSDSYVKITNDENVTRKQWIIIALAGPICGILSIIAYMPILQYIMEPDVMNLTILFGILFHLSNLYPTNGSDGDIILKQLRK